MRFKESEFSNTYLKELSFPTWATWSHFIVFLSNSSSGGAPPQRTWLVHNIDSMADKKGKRLYPHGFDTRVRAAIRVGDYKLITGNPGEGNWVVPPEMDGAVPQGEGCLDNNECSCCSPSRYGRSNRNFPML